MKTEFAYGFAINRATRSTLLTNKSTRLLSGIGGVLFPSESPQEALMRYFQEEVQAHQAEWEVFARFEAADHRVYFARAWRYDLLNVNNLKVIPLNEVWIWPTAPNLKWLLGLAMDESLTLPVVLREGIHVEQR